MTCKDVVLSTLAEWVKNPPQGFPTHWPRTDWPKAINCGWCGAFADDVVRIMVEQGVLGAWVVHSKDVMRDLEVLLDGEKVIFTHLWVYFDGRHYDSEAPEGVEDWTQLPSLASWSGQVRRLYPAADDKVFFEQATKHWHHFRAEVLKLRKA